MGFPPGKEARYNGFGERHRVSVVAGLFYNLLYLGFGLIDMELDRVRVTC